MDRFDPVLLTGVTGQAIKWIMGAIGGHAVGSAPFTYLPHILSKQQIMIRLHILYAHVHMLISPYGTGITKSMHASLLSHKGV